ncbi:hypothetical protein GCM10010430_61890 [Kitasatospora cystarginea]|uniref:Uncharacterized protein n=2 Tax=Streptomycetaceae TaxID=2062 RepID=A0ABP5RRT5_9ACTN
MGAVHDGIPAVPGRHFRCADGCVPPFPLDPNRFGSVTQRGGPFIMAKALLGYVGGPDPRMLSEMRRLQQRVQDLEAELARVQEENAALTAVADEHSLLSSIDLDQREPALT